MSVDKTALNCIIAIVEDKGYANLVLKENTRDMPSNESKAVYATVYTTLEHLLHLDYILASFCKRQKRIVRNILRMSLAKGLFMHAPAYAVTSNAVNLCKKLGKTDSSGLVNAVLKKALNDPSSLPALPSEPLKRLSIQYSYPEWIVELFCDSLGIEAAERLIASPPTGMELRAQHPYTREQLQKIVTVPYSIGTVDENCLRLDRGIDVSDMDEFNEGKFTIQSQGSMSICRAIGDMHGKMLLDACAAPGGKSAYIYSLSEGNADITCWEFHAHRVELLKRTLNRLHVDAKVEQKDAALVDEKYLNAFDAVLIDAPCSGFGLLNEKIDIRYGKSPEDIDSLVALQKRLLDACCRYVKPNGLLVYSTCTISLEENQIQVQDFLKEHQEFCLCPDGMRQLLPHVDGVDGFFYAVMKRCI